MPYLSHRKIAVRSDKHDVRERHNDKWNIFYQDRRWKKLRHWYITNHPICEDCLFEGRSVPAEHVHHKVPYSWFDSTEDKFSALLDDQNLMSLCSEHHHKRHKDLHKPDNFEQSDYYKKIHSMTFIE